MSSRENFLCFCGGFLYTVTKHLQLCNLCMQKPEDKLPSGFYFLEETDLAGIWQITESTGLFQHLHMGLGDFGAGKGDFLNGQEGLTLPTVHQVPGSAFTQAGDSYERRQDLSVLDQELGGMAFVNADGGEFETS